MTLSTHVYLLTEADPRDVFFECRRLLGATDEHPWVDDREGQPWRPENQYILRNRAGIGLNALLWVRYCDGAMLRATQGCDEDCGEDCTGEWHEPPHWIDVDFDTAYSYTDSYGGCGALHARLVFELGQWLDERGVLWAWRNEFTGDVHIGDRYARLRDLVEGGQEAMRWFKGTVEPAIGAIIGTPAFTGDD